MAVVCEHIVMVTQRQKPTSVEKVLFGLMVLSFVLVFWFGSHYFATCPRVPDSQSGHIYPLDSRGKIVYLTKTENSKMVAAESFFFGTLLAAVAFRVLNWGVNKLKVRAHHSH